MKDKKKLNKNSLQKATNEFLHSKVTKAVGKMIGFYTWYIFKGELCTSFKSHIIQAGFLDQTIKIFITKFIFLKESVTRKSESTGSSTDQA